jgi:flagellar hook-basal body complex protein FliE
MVLPVSLSQAAAAYMNAANSADDAAAPASVADTFSDMVSHALSGMTDSLQNAENLSLQSALGAKANLTDLVTAVSNAELTLNTIVTLRDRAISAYEDILKMPI